MKNLFFSFLIIFSLTGITLAQKGRNIPLKPQPTTKPKTLPSKPKPPPPAPKPNHQQIGHNKHNEGPHHEFHYCYPHYYIYPQPYYYPYYYPQPYYVEKINPEPIIIEPSPFYSNYVRNPLTDKLERRRPGCWEKDDKNNWKYKILKQWPVPGCWIHHDNGKWEWKYDLQDEL